MMNKNLKTILLGVFTLISSTEMVYPIIFTGPGRRAAHRHEAEDAYAAGMAAGADGMMSAQNHEGYFDDESDEDSDVAIQMRGTGPEEQIDLNQTPILPDPDNNSFDQEEFLNQYGDNLLAQGEEQYPQEVAQTEEQYPQEFLEEESNENDQLPEEAAVVATTEIDNQPNLFIEEQEATVEVPVENNEEYFNNDDNQVGVDQALEDAELDDDLAAANNDNLFNAEDGEELVTDETQDDVATQSVEPEVQDQPAAVPTLLAAPVEKIKEVQAASVPTPVVAQPAQEQVKIVKVYPVYDALRSAVKAVNNAVHDMINYVYSFVNSPKQEIGQSAPVEAAQPESIK